MVNITLSNEENKNDQNTSHLLNCCPQFDNILVTACKIKDYKKIRLLEPEDRGFVKIKTINPLLYKDL